MATGRVEKGYQKHVRKCQRKGKAPMTHDQYVKKIKNINAKCRQKMEEEFDLKGLEECKVCGGIRRLFSVSDDIPGEDYECECEC